MMDILSRLYIQKGLMLKEEESKKNEPQKNRNSGLQWRQGLALTEEGFGRGQ